MSFGHVKKHEFVTLRILRMREANNILYKLVAHAHAQREGLTSNMTANLHVRSGTRQQHLWRNTMAAASNLSFPT